MPGFRFAFRQAHTSQSLSQIAAQTDLLAVGHETGEWLAVFQQHKRNVLIVGPVNAISEIASGLSYGDTRLFHGIRIGDSMILRFAVSRNSRRASQVAKEPFRSLAAIRPRSALLLAFGRDRPGSAERYLLARNDWDTAVCQCICLGHLSHAVTLDQHRARTWRNNAREIA